MSGAPRPITPTLTAITKEPACRRKGPVDTAPRRPEVTCGASQAGPGQAQPCVGPNPVCRSATRVALGDLCDALGSDDT